MTVPQFLSNLRSWLPEFTLQTAVNVGASVARTTPAILDEHPGATVHALTPVRAALDRLRETAGEGANIRPHRIALGFSPEPLTLGGTGTKLAQQLVDAGEEGETSGLNVTRGDIFCRERGIEHISFVNIETGDLDFDVLRGFGLMLGDGRIDLIQVDCNMNPARKWAGLPDFLELLEPLGYRLFHIYDQKMERHALPVLSSARCAFIAGRIAAEAQERKRQANSRASRM